MLSGFSVGPSFREPMEHVKNFAFFKRAKVAMDDKHANTEQTKPSFSCTTEVGE